MDGMRALDVGTWDGFWAFEMERRGADVLALDLDDPQDLDWPPRRRPPVGATERRGEGFERPCRRRALGHLLGPGRADLGAHEQDGRLRRRRGADPLQAALQRGVLGTARGAPRAVAGRAPAGRAPSLNLRRGIDCYFRR